MDRDGVLVPSPVPPEQEPGKAARPAPRRVVAAWGLWDWGQQTFNTVVLTFVFSVYITSAVAPDDTIGSAALGSAQAWAGIAIALLCPVMGTFADRIGRRRQLLAVSTFALAASMIALTLVQPDPSWLSYAVWMLAFASVVSEIASVFYNGMLLQIATPSTFGRISGMGWGLGYLGGLVALVASLFLFVLGKEPETIRFVALFSGIWTAVFCLPLLILGPNTPPADKDAPRFSFIGAYRDIIARIVRMWREQRYLLHFFVASAIYRDGLAGAFAFAGVIAAGHFAFTQEQVIYLGIAANLVAGVSTWLCGRLDDRAGSRKLIIGGLGIIIAAGIGILTLEGTASFWVCALVISACVGPVQSASRALLARLTPLGLENENFGLYATSGRAVAFLSPFAFTVAIGIGGAQLWGILGIVVVLVVGLLAFLPLRVPTSGGRPVAA